MYERHDSVARVLHYAYCEKYGLKPVHYTQKVPSVMQNERVQIWWNEKIDTVNPVTHCVPDLVIFDQTERLITVIEVSVAWFTGLTLAEDRKYRKYCVNGELPDAYDGPEVVGPNLMAELKETYRNYKAVFIPVVIGACGEITKRLSEEGFEKLGLPEGQRVHLIARMSRSAVLGTDRIIRTHLSREGIHSGPSAQTRGC
jgi:hypothetical protein